MLVKELDRAADARLHVAADEDDALVNAINAIPATNLLLQAQTALYLVATSSQYQVER